MSLTPAGLVIVHCSFFFFLQTHRLLTLLEPDQQNLALCIFFLVTFPVAMLWDNILLLPFCLPVNDGLDTDASEATEASFYFFKGYML